jgi:hypothetical protein
VIFCIVDDFILIYPCKSKNADDYRKYGDNQYDKKLLKKFPKFFHKLASYKNGGKRQNIG